MGKNCLNKLSGNTTVDCSVPNNGIKDIYLMHSEDVSISLDANGIVSAAPFAAGTKSYRIEGYKQNIQVTTSARSMDASSKLDISVIFKLPTVTGQGVVNASYIRAILTGKFYVLAVTNASGSYIVGDTSPLECSGFDYDSNTNSHLATVTLSAVEGSSGNYLRSVPDIVKESIIAKSV